MKPALRRVRAQRLMLEFDDARSGSFDPLRDIPDDKEIVLGLVTTKSPGLERVADLAARIREAGRLFPLQQLGVSTQCGFSASVVGNRLTIAEQNAKLGIVAETAHEVWG